MDLHQLIIRPVVTEKSAAQEPQLVYTLEVSDDSNKIEVARAIEKLYGSKVESVRVLRVPAKTRKGGRTGLIKKRPATKRAIITLKKGEKAIDFAKVKKSK